MRAGRSGSLSIEADRDRDPACGVPVGADGAAAELRIYSTADHVPLEEMLARQGIHGPQGLDRIGDSELLDDEAEDAHWAAITDDHWLD